MNKDRKYNRRILAETLKLTSPRLSTVKGENYRLKTKLKAMVLVASSEGTTYSSKDMLKKMDSYGTNKFMDWMNHIFEVIRRFFTQMWRALTTNVPKLKKNIEKTIKLLAELAVNVETISNVTHKGIYIRHEDKVKEAISDLKEIHEFTNKINDVINQRLKDLASGNKIEMIKDAKIFQKLTDQTTEWDTSADSKIASNPTAKPVVAPYIVVEDADGNLPEGININDYTQPETSKALIGPLKKHLVSLENYEHIYKIVQANLDRLEDKRRNLMRSINKNTAADGVDYKAIKNELSPLLTNYLRLAQNHFASNLKWVGSEMKEFGKMFKLLHKDYVKGERQKDKDNKAGKQIV